LAVLAVRLPFILGGVFGGDAAYHARAAVTVLNGGLLYRDVPYTYPPLYAYTEALAIGLLGNTSLGWKATAQIYDLGSIVLIYLIVHRISNRNKALLAAGLYGFSPLPLLATSSFISFDSTAAFWMLLSLLLLLDKRVVSSAVALGIGTAYKYFPLFLLPAALVYLSTKRQKIAYTIASVGALAIIQLPFVLTEFSAWLDNVILYHLNRPASGATIYNLITFHPQLTDVQSPLTILSPIMLLLAFLLVAVADGKSEVSLLKNSAFLIVIAVFFNKVVLFYALWFIPLLCTFFFTLKKRTLILLLIPFFSLQAALLLGWYIYDSTSMQNALSLGYVYLFTSGLVLAWLLRDRLLFALKRHK
jgi:4-amino-4-deoxy-L-arabinose transferase-like glycosyltransferase